MSRTMKDIPINLFQRFRFRWLNKHAGRDGPGASRRVEAKVLQSGQSLSKMLCKETHLKTFSEVRDL